MSRLSDRTKSILVVTGETSGEAHAAGLIGELRKQVPDQMLHFFGSGGSRMAEEGVELLLDVSRLSAIGPWAAVANTRDYLRLFRTINREARSRRPHLAILVDFPDFNLRLAKRLKSIGIPVCYFISPQVWAWRPGRMRQIRLYIDLMLVIFPFEEDFHRNRGVEAYYVGNPTVTAIRRYLAARSPAGIRKTGREQSMIALLPGSRRNEIKQILPVQLDAAAYLAQRRPVRFSLIAAPEVPTSLIEEVYGRWRHRKGSELNLRIDTEDRYDILLQADCAIVKSGTSTLEAMLLGVPFAMVYRISYWSWLSLRPFVPTGTFCLANLVAGKQIVPEFVQMNATGSRIGAYILSLIENIEKGASVQRDLKRAAEKLGDSDAYLAASRKLVTRFFLN